MRIHEDFIQIDRTGLAPDIKRPEIDLAGSMVGRELPDRPTASHRSSFLVKTQSIVPNVTLNPHMLGKNTDLQIGRSPQNSAEKVKKAPRRSARFELTMID
jgi:hypothetical protein